MKKMILTTDFSDNAKVALNAGIEWAKANNMTPVVIHAKEPIIEVVETRFIGKKGEIPGEKEYQDLREKLDNLLSDLNEPELEYELWRGHPVDCILKSCEQNKADMIVLGLRGIGFFEELLVGSVAQKVLELSKVNVLAVHEKAKGLTKRPLLCCDFLGSSTQAFQMAQALSKNEGVTMDILHVLNPKTVVDVSDNLMDISSLQEALTRAKGIAVDDMNKLAEKLDCETNSIVCTTHLVEVGDQILEQAEKNKNDLLIMGSHGHHGLKKWLLGSTVEYVAKRAQKSILVCK